jgi:flavin-dependent dehydrogenase
LSDLGEMHVRQGRYVGVAPLPGGQANVCLVQPSGPGDRALADPAAALRSAIDADLHLRRRFAAARFTGRPVTLGPLAVEPTGVVVNGLLLAGDAAGFIDPMTGDGLRFAVRGGELAAAAAIDALQHGWPGVHERLARARAVEFSPKWRFNRVLRRLVASPAAVRTAGLGAVLAPGLLRAAIAHAGDCHLRA